MTPAELAGWQKAARDPSLGGADRGKRPCIDCTADFARENRAVGLCNGYPQGDSHELRVEYVRTSEASSILRIARSGAGLDHAQEAHDSRDPQTAGNRS